MYLGVINVFRTQYLYVNSNKQLHTAKCLQVYDILHDTSIVPPTVTSHLIKLVVCPSHNLLLIPNRPGKNEASDEALVVAISYVGLTTSNQLLWKNPSAYLYLLKPHPR